MNRDRINISQPLRVINLEYAGVDASWGPYTSINEALTELQGLLTDGLRVGILTNNAVEPYIYYNGSFISIYDRIAQKNAAWCQTNAVTIGENKHWYIGGIDTGITAEGAQGKPGIQGIKGEPGTDGKDGVDGTDGKSTITAYVYKRANVRELPELDPLTTEGTFENPYFNTKGWSKYIPDGSDALYMQQRIFTSDNTVQDAWEYPILVVDESDKVDVCYYKETPAGIIPDEPTAHGKQGTNPDIWHDDMLPGDVWMAIATKNDGTWGKWSIARVKGEKGNDGEDAVTNLLEYGNRFENISLQNTEATYSTTYGAYNEALKTVSATRLTITSQDVRTVAKVTFNVPEIERGHNVVFSVYLDFPQAGANTFVRAYMLNFGNVPISTEEPRRLYFSGSSSDIVNNQFDLVFEIEGLNKDNTCVIDLYHAQLEYTITGYPTVWKSGLEDTDGIDYLHNAMQQDTTDINGGVVLTQVMALRDELGNVTAGMSGLDEDDLLLWGGGSYEKAVRAALGDEKLPTLITNKGTGNIGCFNIKSGDEVLVVDEDKKGEILITSRTNDSVYHMFPCNLELSRCYQPITDSLIKSYTTTAETLWEIPIPKSWDKSQFAKTASSSSLGFDDKVGTDLYTGKRFTGIEVPTDLYTVDTNIVGDLTFTPIEFKFKLSTPGAVAICLAYAETLIPLYKTVYSTTENETIVLNNLILTKLDHLIDGTDGKLHLDPNLDWKIVIKGYGSTTAGQIEWLASPSGPRSRTDYTPCLLVKQCVFWSNVEFKSKTLLTTNGLVVSNNASAFAVECINGIANIYFRGLPQKDPHRVGQLWIDRGVLKVSDYEQMTKTEKNGSNIADQLESVDWAQQDIPVNGGQEMLPGEGQDEPVVDINPNI